MTVKIMRSILALPFNVRQMRLKETRLPLTQEEFVKQVLSKGGDQEAALIVFQRLKDWIYVKGFSPYPEDNLVQVYGIAEEELDEDLILDLLHQLEIRVPTETKVLEFGRIDTPLKVAQFVSLARAE
jgi:hypothetical protein